MTLELPWPPSVNHYWHRRGTRTFVSKRGIQFRDEVYYLCNQYRGNFSDESRLRLIINAYPPDRRRRDLDNICKSLLDSMQYAGIYSDDNQIDFLQIQRMPSIDGKVIVSLSINQSI